MPGWVQAKFVMSVTYLLKWWNIFTKLLIYYHFQWPLPLCASDSSATDYGTLEVCLCQIWHTENHVSSRGWHCQSSMEDKRDFRHESEFYLITKGVGDIDVLPFKKIYKCWTRSPYTGELVIVSDCHNLQVANWPADYL